MLQKPAIYRLLQDSWNYHYYRTGSVQSEVPFERASSVYVCSQTDCKTKYLIGVGLSNIASL
jgi:hypothetical protein